MAINSGISNRMTPEEESRDRHEHPPEERQSPPPEDASGKQSEADELPDDGQTSHKAGSRSVAQKEASSRHADRTAPSAQKVPGAFGSERHEP